MKMTRNEFLKSMAAASVAVTGVGAAASMTAACAQPASNKSMHGLSLGVSVYSLGADFLAGTTNLEKTMADIADMGAEYVEILGETHVPGYPNPTTEWIDQFYGWLEKYNLKQSAYDIFCDTMFYKDRLLTPEELLEFLIVDMKVASQLGYHVFRQQVAPYPADDPSESYLAPYVMSTDAMKYLELAIPYCEQYDIKLALELHSPTQIRSRWIDGCLELIERTQTPYIGFAPDFSMFTIRPRKGTVEQMVEQGAKKEILDYIISAYQENLGPEKTVEEVKKMGGGEIEQNFAGVAGIYHASNNDPNDLNIIAPWVYHTHAKFYHIEDDLSTDYSMNYPLILENYVKNGITGVLSSECEGMRSDVTRPTHIRMQHAMIRNILASL